MGDGNAAEACGDLDQGSEHQNPQGHVASAVENRRQVAVAGRRPPRPATEAQGGARPPQEAAMLRPQGGDALRFAGNPLLHGPLRVCIQGASAPFDLLLALSILGCRLL